MHKIHIIYRTVNLTTGEYYIGKHATCEINDGYLGSGLRIRRSIKKYGKNAFKREILHIVADEKAASELERQMVNEDLLSDPLCMNIANGGEGGNLGETVNKKIGEIMSVKLSGRPKSTEHCHSISESLTGRVLNQKHKDNLSSSVKLTWTNMSTETRREKCGHPGVENGFWNKSHSPETLELLSRSAKERFAATPHPSSTPIMINGVTYTSHKECMLSLGLSKRQLAKIKKENTK